ncbi:hypothetical protein PGT21_024303 [Puccinia graminis f. sp. tritici]|uniref:Uncharacterized protein n=1 Tax=Puccinia graminis f. sp. tritici TaxID=56615 RepID=A0A5B0N3A3_PUCGR|nr:hypothetical protein PGT21_024303 [Puccinia graminis f. sp. tritici]KAA1124001.1 hypothetical protein PGTUg99_018090 [Puccinia graminis f. sp. tritici]
MPFFRATSSDCPLMLVIQRHLRIRYRNFRPIIAFGSLILAATVPILPLFHINFLWESNTLVNLPTLHLDHE